MRDSFLPDTIHRYTIGNVKISSDFKLYDESIPPYLHNLPYWFVKHCMQRLHAAKMRFTDDDIQKLTACMFLAKGQSTRQDSNEMRYFLEVTISSLLVNVWILSNIAYHVNAFFPFLK